MKMLFDLCILPVGLWIIMGCVPWMYCRDGIVNHLSREGRPFLIILNTSEGVWGIIALIINSFLITILPCSKEKQLHYSFLLVLSMWLLVLGCCCSVDTHVKLPLMAFLFLVVPLWNRCVPPEGRAQSKVFHKDTRRLYLLLSDTTKQDVQFLLHGGEASASQAIDELWWWKIQWVFLCH